MEAKLIEAVRDHTVLYDPAHADYAKTKLKSKIWSGIAREIGMQSGSEAKGMWLKLRQSLRDAQRRQSRCTTTFKPWRYQTAMSYLQPYMTKRKMYDSDENLSIGNNEEMESEYSHDIDGVECSIVKLERTTPLPAIDYLDCSTKHLNPESPTGSSSRENLPPPKKQFMKNEDVPVFLGQSLDNRPAERALVMDKIPATNDALYYFFMSMYQTTKAMPPFFQHKVKNQIFNAVADMEASLLNISDNDSQPAT